MTSTLATLDLEKLPRAVRNVLLAQDAALKAERAARAAETERAAQLTERAAQLGDINAELSAHNARLEYLVKEFTAALLRQALGEAQSGSARSFVRGFGDGDRRDKGGG